ncbi:bacterio-opsin activator domain-containing protein [Haloarchaeobius amylolyticus]|uniref:bacterio-opsin activator domain-containing protein n=1 Tax=Haloarchaeobius amylolyticus TaxID=1198296 RepID=UPI0022715DEF|nr:bacterio-opsin activator domain-containing protein [Haloarchaeobius amylolyticus]
MSDTNIDDGTATMAPTLGRDDRDGTFGGSTLDAIPTQFAVLDTDGTIVYTNDAWRDFARDNDYKEDPGMVGANYLDVCDQSATDDATDAATGIRGVLDDDRDTYSLEYPCHSPAAKRWFVMRASRFSHGDDDFVLVLHLDITGRKESEAAVEHRNRQLEQVNRVGRLVREVIGSLLDVSRREDIESIVCRELSTARFCRLAWVVDRSVTGHIRPRDGAGEDDLLEELAALTPETVEGTTVGEALDGQGPLVQRDRDDAVQRLAAATGCTAYLAVPLTYRGARYGTLVVHTAQPDAFGELERDAFAVLGNTLGYAINAVESRELLHGDYATELRLAVDDPHAPLATVARTVDATLEVTSSGVADDGLRVFVEAAGVDPETVVESLTAHDDVAHASVLGERGGRCRFSCVLTAGSPLLSVAQRGASNRNATIAAGEYELTVEAASTADVGDLVGQLQAEFDRVDLRAKKRVERESDSALAYWERLEARLTDRQLAILEASFDAGYFEWPRAADGGDLADSFDISAPTFHEHLRAGLGKVMSELFEGER